MFEFNEYLALLVALVVTYITGSIVERRHFASLRRRERASLALPLTAREAISTDRPVGEVHLVVGSCVVSADFFKRTLAALRGLIGGRVAAYESVVDRARREAILRLKAQAEGAIEVTCLRLATANVGPGRVEAIAYGTALYPSRHGGESGKRMASHPAAG